MMAVRLDDSATPVRQIKPLLPSVMGRKVCLRLQDLAISARNLDVVQPPLEDAGPAKKVSHVLQRSRPLFWMLPDICYAGELRDPKRF
jgi:hypothetical protein